MGDHELPGIRFGVLGPLVAHRGNHELSLGTTQQRVVLCVLLLHANQRLGREQLIDAVWGEALPSYAVNLVQKHISSLRRTLDPDHPSRQPSRILTWSETGYRLIVPDGCLDLDEFERSVQLARSARAAGDRGGAAAALDAARSLWRGPAFEGLSSPLLDAERDRLADRMVGIHEERIDVALSLGAAEDLIPQLRQLISQHPLRERLRELLMLALYRSGRLADALEEFRRARHQVHTELGVEPGPGLRELHKRMLADDPALGRPAAGDPGYGKATTSTQPVAVMSPPVPAQLPPALHDFTGREAEFDSLNDLLERCGQPGGATMIAAIAGTAGVGKTALAVQWAHQVRNRFPDGQLYVNLRGFEPMGQTAEPAEAVRGFLDGLGVPTHQIPVSFESQAALYRSIVADRRMLILLDNARDSEQVRPLLPAGSACLVLVTSRNELGGLLAVDGACHLMIDLLTPVESRRLLERRLGAARMAGDPRSVDDIIGFCARLPLALTVAAARAVARPTFPLSVLAAELREVQGRLDAFDGGDHTTDIRAVFSWSYQALTPAAARLFRMLGLHPGPHVTTGVAASLAGLPLHAARRPLAELARASLLAERSPGRFTCHDLLRAYARELAEEYESATCRDEAIRRMLDHYLHTASRAHQLLNPYHDEPIELPPPRSGVTIGRLDSHDNALAWFSAERNALLTALRWARDAGLDTEAWHLVWALTPFLEYQGDWQQWQTALESHHDSGEPEHRALNTRLLGRALVRLARFDEANAYLTTALTIYTELDDAIGMAHTHRDLCWKLDLEGDFEAALPHAERAYELFRAAGHRAGEARALNAIGWFNIAFGRYETALAQCQDALRLQREIGDRFGQGETLDSLGKAYRHLGDTRRAVDCYEQAHALYHEFDDRFNEADTLDNLAEVHVAAGDPEAAVAAWNRALQILDRLHHPDADRIRMRLDSLARAARRPDAALVPIS